MPDAVTNVAEPMAHGSQVFFHFPCADGFTAAWTAWTANPAWEYIAASHNDLQGLLPEGMEGSWMGEDVYFLDICPPRDVLARLCDLVGARGHKVYVIDHHVSAKAALDDFEHDALVKHFDMNRSGAGLAWAFFHPNEETPLLVKLVEDRDLWRFNFKESKSFASFLFSLEYDFELWNDVALNLELPDGQHSILSQGDAIERKHAKDVAELVANGCDWQVIGGWEVPVINAPYFYASELGHALARGVPFAAVWYENQGRRYYSLRSEVDEGIDVSQIATLFGGGGHKHAAGFNIASEGAAVRNLEAFMLDKFKEPVGASL
jgi:hypothetical protein